MRLRAAFAAMTVVTVVVAAGCNGGTSTSPPVNTPVVIATPTPVPTATPVPTPAPAQSATGSVALSTTSSRTIGLGPIGGGYFGTTIFPPSNVVANISETFSLTQPSGTPTVQSARRRPANIGAANISPFGFFSVTPRATVTLQQAPSFSMQFPTGTTVPPAGLSYIAFFDPTQPANGWTTLEGPATLVASNTLSWTPPNVPFTMAVGQTYVFVAFSNAGPIATPSPVPTPTPSPVPTPTPQALTVNPNTLSFTVAGASQTFVASEPGYAGALTASSNCSGIATFSAGGAGPSATFTVTSVAAGICQISAHDTNGQSANVQINVTTTSGTINGVRR